MTNKHAKTSPKAPFNRSKRLWHALNITPSSASQAHIQSRKTYIPILRFRQANDWKRSQKRSPIKQKIEDYTLVRTPELAALAYGIPEIAFRRKPSRESNPVLERLAEDLKGLGVKNRKSAWTRRIQLALIGAHRYRHPTFWTLLTVRPEDRHTVFHTNAWTQWIKHLRKATDDLRYIAVAEKGQRGTPHIHCLMIARTWPPHSLTDPQRWPGDHHRESKPPIPWPWGWTQWRPYRVNEDDAWAARGHAWPNERKAGIIQPVPRRPITAGAYYVAKYLFKEQSTPWQTKATHRLGMRRIANALHNHPTLRRLVLQNPKAARRVLRSCAPSIKRYATKSELSASSEPSAPVSAVINNSARASIWDTAKSSLHPHTYTQPSTGSSSRGATSHLDSAAASILTATILDLEEALKTADRQLWADIQGVK